MTTIEKLGIVGIRSYQPEEETVFKFHKPLTIVVGHNGSGKSTVIESIKMATTGELPPMVSQGAAFINDPRIRNATETNAKIRLQFVDVRGQEFVVSRHFSLRITRGGKLEFKTVDQTLKQKKRRRGSGDGEEEGQGRSTSYRCADLNALLPDLMQVTKPILNSVIFVHQEDSLWPLGDPKKLKERFDDIFAATRYTKALESIRKYRKEQAAELRVVSSELLRHEEKAKACEQLREEAATIREHEQRLARGVQVLDSNIAEISRFLSKAESLKGDFEEVDKSMTGLNATLAVQRKAKSDQCALLGTELVELDDEELSRTTSELDEDIRRSEEVKRDRIHSIDRCRADLDEKSNRRNLKKTELGVLQKEADTQKGNLAALERRKHELVAMFFTGPDSLASSVETVPTVDSNNETWQRSLEGLRSSAKANVRTLTATRRDAEDTASEAVSNIQILKSTDEAAIERNNKLSKQKAAAIVEKKALLNAAEMECEGGQEEIEDAKGKLEEAVAAEKMLLCSDKLETCEQGLQRTKEEALELDSKRAILKRKRGTIVQDHDLRSLVKHAQTDYTRKKRAFASKTEDLADKVSAICEIWGVATDGVIAGSGDDMFGSDGDDVVEVLDEADREEDVKEHIKEFERVCTLIGRLVGRRKAREGALNTSVSECKERYAKAVALKDDYENKLAVSKAELVSAEKEGLESKDGLAEKSRSITDLNGCYSVVDKSESPLGFTLTPENEERLDAVYDRASDVITDTGAKEGSLRFRASTYADFVKEFKKNAQCPTCGYHSDDSKVQETQLQFMGRMLEKYMDTSVEEETARLQAQIEYAEQLQEWCGTMKQHCKLVATARQHVQVAQMELRSVESHVQASGKALVDAEQELLESAALYGKKSGLSESLNARTELFRLSRDRDAAYVALKKQRAKLPPGLGGDQTLEDVDRELEELEKGGRKLQSNADDFRQEIEELKNQRVQSQSNTARSREKLVKAESAYAKQGRLRKEREQLKAEKEELDLETRTLAKNIGQLAQDLEEAQKTFAGVRDESARMLESANVSVSKVEMALGNWSRLVEAVNLYRTRRKAEALVDVENELVDLEKVIDSIQDELRMHTKDMETDGDVLREKGEQLRNAMDNHKYRGLTKEVQMYQGQLRELGSDVERLKNQSRRNWADFVAEIGKQNTPGGVENERERSVREKNPDVVVKLLNDRLNDAKATHAATSGKRQVYEERWAAKKEEIKEADKSGSMKKYEECRITKQTMELASSDLDRYHRALDQALMSFHALKMDNINKSIRELWQSTYSGTDIDNIEIASDAGSEGVKGGGAAGKRNYNYRVIMTRGDAKLDMRGRCSAGQKVLACLVIRLALAESFCTDCGILALDEPTTNLDEAHSETLASALCRLIESRKHVSNFQLILITHDKSFLARMNARSFCDQYYMVHKDANGFSVRHDVPAPRRTEPVYYDILRAWADFLMFSFALSFCCLHCCDLFPSLEHSKTFTHLRNKGFPSL